MQEQNTVGILKFGSALVVGFGVVIAMAAYPPTAGIAQFLLDLVIWPVDGVQAISGPEMRLLSAVSGGVMVGWGILLWLVATRLYPKDPGLARTLILVSIGTWFLVDSLASIVAGRITERTAQCVVSGIVLLAIECAHPADCSRATIRKSDCWL